MFTGVLDRWQGMGLNLKKAQYARAGSGPGVVILFVVIVGSSPVAGLS